VPTSPLRALVVSSSRTRGVLAAARALGGSGWTVGIGTPDDGGMVAASRWCSRHHHVPRPRGDCREFIDGVRAAIRDGGYEVVFGGGDDWAAALGMYADELDAHVAHPAADVMMRALDKEELVARAKANGLATPHTVHADDAAMAYWTGPVFVKCRTHWFPGQEHRERIEARAFPDIDAASAQVRQLRDAGFDVVLQAPIAGRLSALIGLFDGTRLRGRVQQTTFGSWPTPAGPSARAETEPVDEYLVEGVEAMLADIGWQGLVEVQFVTPAGGLPHVIDLNGRFYGSMALAIGAGVNLPDAWGRQVLGLPLPDLPDGEPGVRYVWGAGDLRRAVTERRGGLARDVASSVGWLLGPSVTSVFDVRDPAPTMHLVTARLRRAVDTTQ